MLQHRDLVGGRLVTLAPRDSRISRLFPAKQARTLPWREVVSASPSRHRSDVAGICWDRVRFDERYAHGSDDLVFALRAQAAGASVGFAEHALCQYRLRPNVRAVSRQLASYSRAEADFIANEEPFADRGPIDDVGRLFRSVLGLGLSRSTVRPDRSGSPATASAAKARRLDQHRRARGNRWSALAGPPSATSLRACVRPVGSHCSVGIGGHPPEHGSGPRFRHRPCASPCRWTADPRRMWVYGRTRRCVCTWKVGICATNSTSSRSARSRAERFSISEPTSGCSRSWRHARLVPGAP